MNYLGDGCSRDVIWWQAKFGLEPNSESLSRITILAGSRGDRRDAGQRLEGDGTRGEAVGPRHQSSKSRTVGRQLYNQLKKAEKKVLGPFKNILYN